MAFIKSDIEMETFNGMKEDSSMLKKES